MDEDTKIQRSLKANASLKSDEGFLGLGFKDTLISSALMTSVTRLTDLLFLNWYVAMKRLCFTKELRFI